jgi:hypothetical protein
MQPIHESSLDLISIMDLQSSLIKNRLKTEFIF